ncbi:MAG: hypothetical protein U5O39_19810 [Gammaproteobacteria bacterium]|nr:hypothetical protein [Gammaproteobacteria bacterium]
MTEIMGIRALHGYDGGIPRENEMKLTGILFVALLIGGCAVDRSRIDTAVIECCAAESYRTFTAPAENIPPFLGPLMVSNFSVAFASRGMQPVQEDGDVVAVLRYEQIDLTSERARDDFDEQLTTGEARRFIARITIEIRDPETEEIVFSGHIQRLHDVGAGDWMHTGLATNAIFESFNEVLEDYQN